MKLERLLGLISILVSRDKITVQELANRFEVSRRTIFRDLDTLNRAGIPIVSFQGMGGGVAIVEGYKVAKEVLSTNDAEKLFTALSALNSIDKDSSITNLIAKLIPEKKTLFSQSNYCIDLSSWFSDSIIKEKIARIHLAICERRCVRLEYISRDSRSSRIVEPHKLVFKQSSWYLYAYCKIREAFRLFKLSRIVSCDMTDKEFKLRTVEAIEFSSNYGAELFTSVNHSEIFEVILEYDISDEFVLADKIDASFFKRPSNQQYSCGHIQFQAANLAWVAELVLSFVDKVRVISPPELKAKVKQRLDKINIHYKGDI